MFFKGLSKFLLLMFSGGVLRVLPGCFLRFSCYFLGFSMVLSSCLELSSGIFLLF